MGETRWGRRDFLRISAQATGVLSLSQPADVLAAPQGKWDATQPAGTPCESPQSFNGTYEGTRLSQIALRTANRLWRWFFRRHPLPNPIASGLNCCVDITIIIHEVN